MNAIDISIIIFIDFNDRHWQSFMQPALYTFAKFKYENKWINLSFMHKCTMTLGKFDILLFRLKIVTDRTRHRNRRTDRRARLIMRLSA